MPFAKIDPTTPAGTEKKKFGDDRIRELKEQTIANFQAVTNYPAEEMPALRTAVWTTATRPAGDELVDRVTGFNTDTNTFEYFAGGKWQPIGASIQSLNLWKPEYDYVVGDVCYSLGSIRKRFECVTAGKTGTKEPNWPAIGQYITDGTARWIVDDVHDGRLPGDVRFPVMFVRAGEIKLTGQLENRADVPRLVKLATDNGLIVSEAAWAGGMRGLFGEGDGSTTIRMPDLRGEHMRVLDDGRGVDQTNITGNTTSGSATITNIAITGGFTTTVLAIGMSVTGTGIPAGATIASIVSDTSITISVNATATAAGVTLTITGRKLGSAETGTIEAHNHVGTKLGGWDGHNSNTYAKYHSDGSGTTGSTGGPETRGRNIAYYAVMKY
ncbi:hypothetical protein KIAC18_003976 [Sporomusa sphaeroides]|uniref:hypothetical protein n=1 Tax=Sporomusa sphaeroides TaxID=47679 RepID=UPI003DA14022